MLRGSTKFILQSMIVTNRKSRKRKLELLSQYVTSRQICSSVVTKNNNGIIKLAIYWPTIWKHGELVKQAIVILLKNAVLPAFKLKLKTYSLVMTQ